MSGRYGIDAPLEERSVESADGTRLNYYVIGTGPRVWVVPPAMGAPLISLKYVFDRFHRDFTFLSWDMRGFYKSAAPREPSALRIEHHVQDLEAVCAAENATRFVLGGWSMAVQISLELFHRRPDCVRALVLINGPFERPLETALGVPGARGVLPRAVRVGERLGRFVNAMSPRILGRAGAGRVLHRVGVLAANPVFFEQILAEFCRIDWTRYMRLIALLNEHSARDYLAEVNVPTLITAGTNDLLTPMHLAETMHARIRGSELLVIRGGTHYSPAEFPDVLTDGIARFLDRLE